MKIAFGVFDSGRQCGRIEHYVGEGTDIFRVVMFAEVQAETLVGCFACRLFQDPSEH